MTGGKASILQTKWALSEKGDKGSEHPVRITKKFALSVSP